MSTATEKQATIEDVKENLAAAMLRMNELTEELRSLPIQLQDASRRVARERAASAREGQSGSQLLAVASEHDVAELRDRDAALPLEVWSQSLVVAELESAACAAEIEAVEEELKETRKAWERSQRNLALAESAHADAYAAHTSAASRKDTLSVSLRGAKEAVADLEESPPDA
jgi:chromosome segregation ATPase